MKAWPVIFLLVLPFAACYCVGLLERAPGIVAVALFAGALALIGREL